MKKLITFISCLLLMATGYAQKTKKDTPAMETKYCASMGDGKIIVKYNGVALTKDVTLYNGTQILINGVIIKTNGSKLMMNNGECADADGNIIVNLVQGKSEEPKK